MWLASEMAAFAHVAELGSFTAAAKALKVPKVAVSRAVASLERHLNCRLLTRTTRRVALTPAGALLQPHCRRLLQEVESVRSRFAPVTGAQHLRVLTDTGYGRLIVWSLVPRFLEHYAGTQLEVALADSAPAMPESPAAPPSADWDLWICDRPLARRGLMQTPLGSPPLLLCTTPGYRQRHGHPQSPGELGAHALLCAAREPEATPTLRLRRGLEQHLVRLRPTLTVSDPSLVHASTAAGLGIGVLPEFLCRQGLALGKLERVLPEWSIEQPLELAAVYPEAKAGSPLIRQFIEFVLANMVPILADTRARS